ncbi:probable E3 ubiquitin-protein ligase makorin-1 [Hermetia illucens]|nr:probable E3 ubiquitin-protein ligase makorin-1 [Hermetia illucens]
MASIVAAANNDDRVHLICRFYTRGMCRFGNLCRFIHPDPSQPTAAGVDGGSQPASNRLHDSHTAAATTSAQTDPKKWVLAPVFVPKNQQRISIEPGSSSSNDNCKDEASASSTTYAAVVVGPGGTVVQSDVSSEETTTTCPYQFNCPYGDMCTYEHNQMCEMCGRYSLHPTDKEQRKSHIALCIQQHEKDMELSFAIARSKDKTCGICFEIIMEKSGREQRFGILPNCNHIFCLECIRKWRQAKQFDNKIIRACPECRIPSDYVCPSAFWVETKDEKEKLITDYKKALGEKDCKYFKKGEGKCPFGNKCFYKHALPGGERVDVGVPKRNKRKIQRADDEILDLFDLYLWDFVDRREFHWLEILSNFTDSGDSDWSEDFE